MESRHVILVDPLETRDVLAERLRMQGYTVIVTSDPVEGAHLALSDPPAAVIADLWMPGISGVQLCRLMRAEPATQHVPVILRGSEQDQRSRFWSERAGAAAYVGKGRMGDLVRALANAIATAAPSSLFMQLSGGEPDIRDRIAHHLDDALFDSVLAAEVRALTACGTFSRLFDLLSQFVARVTSYRWLAVSGFDPPRIGLHVHPRLRAQAEQEARLALNVGDEDVQLLVVEDEDAHEDAEGPTPFVQTIQLGDASLGELALAVRHPPHPKDRELVSVVARELGGPIRFASLVEESQRLATVDPLTNLLNRRAFSLALAKDIARCKRHGHPLCLILLDIDHFKAINDTKGHAVGDKVLVAVGQTLTQQLRTSDSVGRWGGEEFVAILNVTDASGGLIAAERLRAKIAATQVDDEAGQMISVTSSIGLSVFEPGDSVNTLVDRADIAMYAAKTAGRDRVVRAPVLPESLMSPLDRVG